jgi:hypothetical protein
MSRASAQHTLAVQDPVNGDPGHPHESGTQSFIVKIWVEEASDRAGPARWRGQVTHVPGGERQYAKGFDEISAFIASYLEKMGVDIGIYWRVRRWYSKSRSPASH